MDKKQLATLIEEIITDVATANSLSEQEARTLVGLSLRHNRGAIVQSIVIPTFNQEDDVHRGRRISEVGA